MTTFSATYSPDDNKLRLYASSRLDPETYARVKAAGFAWAPKQELFVAPMWTPGREDLLLELAGEIDDEDTSLTERAEERAERFEEYHEKRTRDAESAHDSVRRIADGIPFGQPILVGHHSERHARKDAERIENGMRRAVKMWETAKYWTDRAEGALAHAKYKERPDVRARRIKKLEADARKVRKSLAEVETLLKYWRDPLLLLKPELRSEPGALEKAVTHLAGRDYWAVYERDATKSGGYLRCYEALASGVPVADVVARAIENKEKALRPDCSARRWIAHYDNRLAYERAMLAESGYIEPPKRATKAALPILNYSGTVEYRNRYTGDKITTEAHGMTADEYTRINKDYKGTFVASDGTHRIRSAMIRHSLVAVYLTDKKQHPKPGAGADTPEQAKVDKRARDARREINEKDARRRDALQHNRELLNRDEPTGTVAPEAAPASTLDRSTVEDMRASLKAGVTVSVVPELFPTPPELAQRMVDLADIEPGHRVLEPSAGTGAILRAAFAAAPVHLVAVEINARLLETTRSGWRSWGNSRIEWRTADFLDLNGDLGTFDRIVMNPPFRNGADIRHIIHARHMLRPGGRLVALCANGPRQRDALMTIADSWEDLPDGTFAAAGTGVRVALLTLSHGGADD